MSRLLSIFKKKSITVSPNAESIDYNDIIERGVLLIDIRSPREYQKAHLPRAINIPLSKLSKVTDVLGTAARPILCYGDQNYSSYQAATYLQNQGIECYHGGDIDDVEAALVEHQYIR